MGQSGTADYGAGQDKEASSHRTEALMMQEQISSRFVQLLSFKPRLPGFSSMFGKKKKRLEISAPSNFEHRVHTGFDPREQKFTGLPQQWQSLLADTANRPKPMVDPSYITPIQLAPNEDISQESPVIRNAVAQMPAVMHSGGGGVSAGTGRNARE
ncbi:unnamed protein product [Pleuronectes platessa]|uniref:non-specific serine/threonine protein kinase n=1 Tax=Pleuronectes platessa TaxID=8262 RepID=A0A9N7YBM3_PLEPL|nr:unnamed protein product [Pleuronectes platessa]